MVHIADSIRRETITTSRTWLNIIWAFFILIGGTAFFLTSLSSYLKYSILIPFKNPIVILFLPQGLVMGLYGIAGFFLGIYLWLIIYWDVGGGFNEFDKKKYISIFRWGFPGKNRQIFLNCYFDEVECLKVETQNDLFASVQLYLKIQGKPNIPLNTINSKSMQDIEDIATELSAFLDVPLELIN
uniref:Photosystem I assembly protein Ycf4 n=1 Tax=Entransia fimbriata TaxID=130991 RepID=A0A191T4U6_9VIRI|nr:hypothetical chloroplast RF4 [Entransia fimbriata]ANI25423.1 hypothetical chloroplast RF4 [Entransia fimbriata]